MTGIFLSLSRVLPDEYPLGDDVETYVAVEHGFGHMLDIGIIAPRFGRLYDWSSEVLALPALRGLVDGSTPTYAWDFEDDADVWDFKPSRLARLARRVVPATLAAFPAFACEREAAVGRLLDQPVDKQRVQCAITLGRVGQPGDVEYGTGYRRVVAAQDIQQTSTHLPIGAP